MERWTQEFGSSQEFHGGETLMCGICGKLLYERRLIRSNASPSNE